MAGSFGDLLTAIQRIKDEYPSMAYLLEIPEVGKLLLKRVAGELDEGKFLAALYETKWWKSTDENRRKLEALSAIDPATYKQMVTQKAAEMKDEAGRLGLQLTQAQLMQGAHFAMNQGFNDAQMADFLGAQFKYQKGKIYGGEFGDTITQLNRTAHDDWLLKTSEDWQFKKAKRIVSGESTMEGEIQNYRRLAMQQYSHLADDIAEGKTLGELFDPYRQMIAAEMDIGTESVDFVDDERWKPILSHDDPDQGKMRVMTQTEALRHVRKQGEWANTSTAREKAASLANDLGKTFGVVGQGAGGFGAAGGVGRT